MDLLAGLGNDYNFGDQPVGLSSDKGAVQTTSEGGNVTDVTFVDDCIVEVAVAEICRRICHGLRKTTFLTERIKILPQLRFLDPGGQFAPIFAWISKVRLQ